MEQGSFLYQALIYLTAAVVLVPIAKRLGLGSVLGYLAAGMAIGPFGLSLVGQEGKDVMHFAEFGVVMMLFLIGLELQPSKVWRLRGPILGQGSLQVSVTALATTVIGILAGLAWPVALAVGLILAKSSTAVVLQTLDEKGLLNTDGGQRAFSVVIFQDIAVIPILAVLPLLATGPAVVSQSQTWVERQPAIVQTLFVLASVAAVVAVGRYGVRYVFRYIAQTRLREMFTVAALLLVVGISALMSTVGLSPALGAFVAGVVLSDNEYRHELMGDIAPFKGLLLGLFFLAVGASMDFALVIANPGLILGLVATLMGGKFLLLMGLGRVFRMSLDQGLLFSFALAGGGEFAFVLFSIAERQRVLSHSIVGPLVTVVALSMGLTPLLILFAQKVILPRFGTREQSAPPADSIDEESPVIVAGCGRFGNIVVRLLRANGVRATVLDLDSDNVDLLRKLGLKVFYGDATRVDLLHAAGADHARLLIAAIDDPDKNSRLVEIARKHFPQLELLVRANSVSDAHDLLEEGVSHVYRETLDTSLHLGVDALRQLGFRAYQAQRAATIFRRHDEAALRDLVAVRHDDAVYLSRSKKRIHDLEEILVSEMTRGDETRDAGWDTLSIRTSIRSTLQDRSDQADAESSNDPNDPNDPNDSNDSLGR